MGVASMLKSQGALDRFQGAWLLATLLLAGGGCATGQADARCAKLEKRLEEIAQRESSNNRRIEDLNTRLFLVEDKVEAAPSAGVGIRQDDGDAMRLPVIRIGPRGEALSRNAPADRTYGSQSIGPDHDEDSDPQDELSDDAAGKTVVASQEVEYSGEAVQSGPRPLLRIRGAGRRTSEGEAEDGVSIDPAHVTERLPVVPVVSRKIAAQRGQGPPEPVDAAVRAYQVALDAYRKGRAKEAIEAFDGFLRAHPGHAYMDNALYWQGECHYDMQQYKAALSYFRRIAEEYPNGNKGPDALLKMGFSYVKLGDLRNARAALTRVLKKYPGTRVATLARERLSKLN